MNMANKAFSTFYAHISEGGPPHLLEDHLQNVARLASEMANNFQGKDWARLAGQWHDLGKYREGFQQYIRQINGSEAHIEGKVAGREKTHSAAGALWAIQYFREHHGLGGELAAHVFAYLIASHHAGLYDWNGGLDARLAEEASQIELRESLEAAPPEDILGASGFIPDLRSIPGGSVGFALWIRMLFSCLVDADFLDTEAYFEASRPQQRAGFPDMNALLPVFDAHMAQFTNNARTTEVNSLRASILSQCRNKATLSPGFFSLTVPTGGGKTLSSLAFALQHAVCHDKCRVIFAIPYTSIIEQTADIFRDVFKSFGDDVLIEHHSQADADEKDETARSRLACENWDAPLIITTNVQLFESLFAAKTSRCRKLHNLVNSVIVLDEAQQLPPGFLQPILDTLNLLVKHYGVTVVLCTATQPALASTDYFDASRNLRGLENVREIIDDPDALYSRLKRVKVELPVDWNTQTSWEEVARRLSAEACVLAIVNTRKAARELHRLMPSGTIHLSALMCGAHRAAVIQQIKDRLKARNMGFNAEPLRVVSTQLVEAGVDLDFPVVWRALAGLDSIAQAAGRCNREGLLAEGGKVVVFVPPEALPLGGLRKAGDACKSALRSQCADPLARELFEQYFRQLYYATDLDARKICGLLKVEPQTLGVQFRSAAQAFRLIDDEDNASVVVRYPGSSDDLDMLFNALKKDGPQRWLMRKLQRYTINIRKREADQLIGRGLSLLLPGLYVQDADDLYDKNLGFVSHDIPFNPSAYLI